MTVKRNEDILGGNPPPPDFDITFFYKLSAYHRFNVSLCHTKSHQWRLLANVPGLCIVFTKQLLKMIC